MGGVCNKAMQKANDGAVPTVEPRGLEICLGFTNCFLFGFGTMIAGMKNKDMADVLIGLFQLLIPIVGWMWSIIWGWFMCCGKEINAPA